MPRKRVLIVDDQHEVRRMLHAWMETLRPSVDVISVPSGEEAILEASRKPPDLLISDVRLPGITGFELMSKIRKRSPGLKFILITGLTDPQVRKEVADAGAYAFFMKPIDMPDFLDAAERALGLVETSLPAAPIAGPEPAVPSLEERLRDLRANIQADALMLIDNQGNILEQAGNIPDIAANSHLLLAMLGSFHASSKVAAMLGSKTHQAITYYKTARYDLVLAHVGPEHFLLSASPINPTLVVPDGIGFAIFDALPRLQESLAKIAISELLAEPVAPIAAEKSTETTTAEPPHPVEAQPSALDDELSEEEINNLEALFQPTNTPGIASRELESFWDSAVDESAGKDAGNASALSFEEARRLGLAPGEAKE